MAISITRPTVGASTDTWGTTLNTGLQAIESTLNGSGTGKVTVAPDLSTLTINGTNVTSTAAELNLLDGVTATTAELNLLDGSTAATASTLVDADRVIVNDDGSMKQVALSDVKTYIGGPTVNNTQITFTAGNALTGGGSINLNQSSAETITIDHADTSSQASVNNSGNTVIQDVTLDGYGHVTSLTSTTLSTGVTGALAGTFSTSDQSGTFTINLGASAANRHIVYLGYNFQTAVATQANSSGQISVTQGGSSDGRTYNWFSFY